MAKTKENSTMHQNRQAAELLLREDDLISKTVQQVKPPITIYNLTPAAEQLSPVLLGMADWAIKISDQFRHLTEVE
jgi:DNA-binding HxlR family transcriptional regulator